MPMWLHALTRMLTAVALVGASLVVALVVGQVHRAKLAAPQILFDPIPPDMPGMVDGGGSAGAVRGIHGCRSATG